MLNSNIDKHSHRISHNCSHYLSILSINTNRANNEAKMFLKRIRNHECHSKSYLSCMMYSYSHFSKFNTGYGMVSKMMMSGHHSTHLSIDRWPSWKYLGLHYHRNRMWLMMSMLNIDSNMARITNSPHHNSHPNRCSYHFLYFDVLLRCKLSILFHFHMSHKYTHNSSIIMCMH